MKIAIVGAGYIGLYIGARLIEVGADVIFVGRDRMKSHLVKHGLKINSFSNQSYHVHNPKYVTDYGDIGKIDLAIITSKTTQTEVVLRELIPHLSSHTKILNLQNGVENKEVFKKHHLENLLVEGMVMFNVVINDSGEFFQSSSGPIIMELKAGDELVSLFKKVRFDFCATENIEGYKWSKLLLNLNNSVNALAGVPIKEEIEQREYRLVLARLIEEAIKVIDAKKIKLENLTNVPPRFIPYVLKLPNSIFKVVAKKMVNIDPLAKTSMLVDLERNSSTEIDFLNARVVSNAELLGLKAPANRHIVSLIREAEARKNGPPRIAAPDLLHRISELIRV